MKTATGAATASLIPQFANNALLAADAAKKAAKKGGIVAYPLNPLEPWINTYKPATGKFAAQQAQTLKVDWMFWQGGAKKPPIVIKIGDIVIQRRPSSDSIEYQITQNRDARQIIANIHCAADKFESVQEWSLDESLPYGGPQKKGAPAPTTPPEMLTCHTTGRVQDGNAHITRHGQEAVVPLDGPLICSWVLMTNPSIVGQLAASKKPFILAEQMSYLRPGHLAKPDIEVAVPNAVRCPTYCVTGHGSSPISVVIHPEIGALFMTLFATSMALTSIENAV